MIPLMLKLFLTIQKIRFENVEKNQSEFELKLSSVRIGVNKSNKQLSEIENITKFYKSREQIIKFHNDYFQVIHKATYISKYRKGLKILSPKQMLQRSPIALAQVKAGNTTKSILN